MRPNWHLGNDRTPGPVTFYIPDEWWNEKKGYRWLGFDGDDGGGRIAVVIQLDMREGRTVTRAVHIESTEPLTTTTLRAIPLAQMVSVAAQQAEESRKVFQYLNMGNAPQGPDPTKAGAMAVEPYFPESPEPPNEAQPWATSSSRRPGRRGHDEAVYKNVAKVWTNAKRTHPRSPMVQTAEVLGYSKAQARRLVRKAEELGLIDTTPRSS